MTEEKLILSATQKALKINLDPNIYGTMVEIGAGQEVARQFFRAGSASGTIAKTMSAYDRNFSDAIYGKEEHGRYVCKNRLLNMLKHEYSLIEERLNPETFPDRKYFTFADTVSTINYEKTNQGHGWIGVRFQKESNSKPNDIILHVNLHDQDAKIQQETIGILGTNLLHACFYQSDPKDILKELYDNISKSSIDIDMVHFYGPEFKDIDNRLLSLTLVKEEMTDGVIFTPDGLNHQPSDILHKKNILALRGSFRPVTKVNIDMLENGLEKFSNDKKVNKENIQVLFEITLSNLKSDGDVDEQDFLDRVDILCLQYLDDPVKKATKTKSHLILNNILLLTKYRLFYLLLLPSIFVLLYIYIMLPFKLEDENIKQTLKIKLPEKIENKAKLDESLLMNFFSKILD